MTEDQINHEVDELKKSFLEEKMILGKHYNELITKYDAISNEIKINSDIINHTEESFSESILRKEILLKSNGEPRNYFTISSKNSFSYLPTKEIDNNWGKSLIFNPLNDHSRSFLHKGDVLFCYRQGQFGLAEALNIRGIYGIGIAASDPIELFTSEVGHNKWGVLVCFPIQLPNHLELKNIQMHPNTIDLTPYNGNRNDSLQHIEKEKQYRTLLNLLYSRNIEIGPQLQHFFSDIEFEKISMPYTLLHEFYTGVADVKKDGFVKSRENLILSEFLKWFKKFENSKVSYEGLIEHEIFNFWNKSYFNSSLFSINITDIEGSIKKIENLIYDENNIAWKRYSQATSKGSPEAILGKKNYLKFLTEYLSDENNIKILAELSDRYDHIEIGPQIKFNYKSFHKMTKDAKLFFSEKLIARFIASICTKPFVICTGLSGSGKTKLAQSFVKWVCESKNQYKIIPVGADWTNREPLMGYPNGLVKAEYELPDSGALQVILGAINNENRPYFIILDEMNLSHVERYFADFLSVMESTDKIKLYSGKLRIDSEGAEIKKDISWPKNLFIIGTVNIDETTYMFSPKVLDRANVIEFRLEKDDMDKYLEFAGPLEMNRLCHEKSDIGLGSNMATDLLNLAWNKPHSKKAKEALKIFFPILQKAGAEFGYRSASEINFLVGVLENLVKEDNKWDNAVITDEDLVDIAIMQKLLPKLHGSRARLIPVLTSLGKLCIANGTKDYEETDKGNSSFIKENFDKEPIREIIYKISFDKLRRMYKNVIANGFTSYAEA